jgi:hypothetical protein
MIGLLTFNVLAIALGLAVGTGLVPTPSLTNMLDWLHSIIGITPPSPHQARIYALVWIVTTIVLVDGLLAMLLVLIRIVK